MKITADTNILVRAIVEDDAAQAEVAKALLSRASMIVIPMPVLCELVWVLRRAYGRGVDEIAGAIAAIAEVEAVSVDHPAVEAGLAVLRAGGDFADGVIAYQGRVMGGEVFASFDRAAVAMLRAQAVPAEDPQELLV